MRPSLLLAACASAPTTVPLPDVPVASLALSPEPDTAMLGRASRVIATARDSAGQPIDADRYALTWSSSDSFVAVVLPAGDLATRRIGTTVIRATSNGVTAELPVTVKPGAPYRTTITLTNELTRVGHRARVAGYVLDAFGNRLQPIAVECDCGSGNVLAAAAKNELWAVGQGQARLRATPIGLGIPGVTLVINIR